MQTRAAAGVEARIAELPEGSLRRQVLESVRRFRASWVELARLLAQVRRDGAWEDWGHASFESYCSKELFLKPATVAKLTLSYGFLERREPRLVRSREPGEAPPFEVIEVLSRAEAAGRLDDRTWSEMREEVLEGGAGRADVNRRIAERFGPPPEKERPPPAERLRRLAQAARRLAVACEEERDVPAALRRHARELAEALERLAGDDA
jgi:hypothetical protein